MAGCRLLYRSCLAALVLLTACYEESVGCLDPDAANYALQADEACPDCCTYPALSVRISPVWGETAVVAGDRYLDGAGDTFQLIDFRFYLGELRLVSAASELDFPFRPVEVVERVGGEDRDIVLDGNYLLGGTVRRSTNVGTVRLGTSSLSGLAGTYGLPDRYRNVVPASAPAGDALQTQPRRLNFRDERGYVQARLEFVREDGGDTISVSSFGSVPFRLSFPEPIVPTRGANVLLDVRADLQDLLGGIDLSADSATIAAGLAQPPQTFLTPTAITF